MECLEKHFDNFSIGNRDYKRRLYEFLYYSTRCLLENVEMNSVNHYVFIGHEIVLINVSVPDDIREIIDKLGLRYLEIDQKLRFDNDSCIIHQTKIDSTMDYTSTMYEKYK